MFDDKFHNLFYQDKAKQHKKLLDEAEDMYKFKEEAKDLVNLFMFFTLRFNLT